MASTWTPLTEPMHSTEDFDWPRFRDNKVHWTGERFESNGALLGSVLPLSAAHSHWDDNLTLLHESAARNGDHPMDLASRQLALQTLKSYVPDGVVLDAGCSSGFLLQDIQRERPDLQLIGSVFLEPLLQRLALRLPKVPLLQFDLTQCPLPDACVDAVTCLNVLEHIENDKAAVSEIQRILKPGGVAHIEVPASPLYYDFFDEYLQHFRRYSSGSFRRLLSSAGFEILNFTHIGFLVFPMFLMVKFKNKLAVRLMADFNKEGALKALLRDSKQSSMLSALMRAELKLGTITSFPIGVRLLAVVRKIP